MAEEDEVRMEVEAVESVYGDDCTILNTFPPHLRLHLKPRTADVHSQQYPSDPPYIDIISSKGLDEKRQKHLSTSLHNKALELESCLMIVSLCEEAVETLSSMNHPEGDCPLCLYPLLAEDELNKSQPFMKLMSCFHCFHCRRHKFETILELQKEHCGLIEPPKDNILFSRLSLEDLVTEPDTATNGEVIEAQETDQVAIEVESSGSSNQTHQQTKRRQRGHRTNTATVEPGSSRSHAQPSTGQDQHSGPRKQGRSNSKVPPQQWSRKE
ncbi:hypothetical protein KSS87_016128 [Heliosperma pusillum]|nr:hypothetical protein KSS87_016128 [Heliosperma pusillum]